MRTEWQCTKCGSKIDRGKDSGRPVPGLCRCNTDSKGKQKPHTWIKLRDH